MAPGVPSQAVYAERIKNAQEAMKQQGIDVLLVGPSSDLVYLIGYDAHLSERLNLLIIRQEGTPDLVVPVLESFLAKGSEPNVTLRRWEETESPSELAASLIGDTNGVTLGVSDQLWSTFLLKLQKAMPAGDWTTGQPILAHLRVTKDQSELDNLFEVARLTDEAWHEFVESGQLSGLTEAQAMERLSGMMEKRGLGRSFGICASGPNAASPHHHTGNRVIQQGDSVIFDWGGTLNGYHSDVTRTVFVGTPTDEYRKVYETVKAGESGGARCGQARRLRPNRSTRLPAMSSPRPATAPLSCIGSGMVSAWMCTRSHIWSVATQRRWTSAWSSRTSRASISKEIWACGSRIRWWSPKPAASASMKPAAN